MDNKWVRLAPVAFPYDTEISEVKQLFVYELSEWNENMIRMGKGWFVKTVVLAACHYNFLLEFFSYVLVKKDVFRCNLPWYKSSIITIFESVRFFAPTFDWMKYLWWGAVKSE